MEFLALGGKGYYCISSATKMAAGDGFSRTYLLQGTLFMNFDMVFEDLLVAEVLDYTGRISLPIDFFMFESMFVRKLYYKMQSIF